MLELLLPILKVVLFVVGAVVIFWMFGMKLIAKLSRGQGMPCPAACSWLVENPMRRREMRHTLDRVALQPGETVLEVGPGPGAFTIEAARRVGPEGKVIAVDLQPGMIAKVEKKVREAGVTNVETHVASAYDLPLPDASVDRAFLVTVLPEISDPVKALREVRRVLKPGGVLSLTEEFYDPDYPRRVTTIRWAEAAGFELAARLGNWWVYTLNFVRGA